MTISYMARMLVLVEVITINAPQNQLSVSITQFTTWNWSLFGFGLHTISGSGWYFCHLLLIFT